MNTPTELKDAIARIEKAKQDYISLYHKTEEFLYQLFEGMPKGKDKQTGDYVIKMRNPKDFNLEGDAKVLTVQIIENLRSALDYLVFQLSAKNDPNLNERSPQFVIADDKTKFNRESKTRLKYLTDEEKKFIEEIQPYHGNSFLRLLRDATNPGKHRQLLEVSTGGKVDIYLDKQKNKDHADYKNAWMFPQDDEMAVFVKLRQSIFVFMDKYDAMDLLKLMIENTERIVKFAYKFF